MASRTGNDAVRALRARQEVERRAVRAVEQAGAALADVVERRRELVARLDGEVQEARAAHELSVVVLATVLRDDGLAAELAGLDVSRVRALRRGFDGKVVRERIAQTGAVVSRRRGRAPTEDAAPRVGPVAGGESSAGAAVGG
ncbi:hypothetical protein [Micromonospora antibiotica]|uniref:Uncharacterized protein n=1 Tax=Micromonospora antibiotica TaxID=2807623 RepID=A0ABS3VF77_9ACTN|nr:hypothetical protein [Micromonospora antibiotica]MBO4164291.1 hypothetical protein [Micromonospora antibiotica]